MAEAPARVSPETTARMVAKATAEMKPMNRLPPTASASLMATMLVPPSRPLTSTSLPSTTAPGLKNSGCWASRTMAAKPMMKVRI